MFAKQYYLEDQKSQVLQLTSHHCFVHYQCSVDYYNYAVLHYLVNNNLEEFQFLLQKAISFYKQNQIAINLLDNLAIMHTQITLKNIDITNHSCVVIQSDFISKARNILLQATSMAPTNSTLKRLLNISSAINKEVATLHYNYHIQISSQYYQIAQDYKQKNDHDQSIWFYKKALETEPKNPQNQQWEAELCEIQSKVAN